MTVCSFTPKRVLYENMEHETIMAVSSILPTYVLCANMEHTWQEAASILNMYCLKIWDNHGRMQHLASVCIVWVTHGSKQCHVIKVGYTHLQIQ